MTTTHPGYWEARAAVAVKAVYADADLRLEALQLDLLEPREDGTRWTVYQVRRYRTEQALVSMRDGFREIGRTLDATITAVGDAARTIIDSCRAATTTTRDDYTLAADQGDPQ